VKLIEGEIRLGAIGNDGLSDVILDVNDVVLSDSCQVTRKIPSVIGSTLMVTVSDPTLLAFLSRF
jgi:hypothetical protein